MFHHRKNFNNAWFAFQLGKEDISKVKTIAVTQGLNTLMTINKVAAANNIKLSDSDKSSLLLFAALTMESFASDFIEAKEAARIAAEKEAQSSSQAPQ